MKEQLKALMETAQQTADDDTATRRVAFFTDTRTTTIALERTVEELIATRNIAHGVVDLHTLAGVTIANTFVKHDIPYDVMWLGLASLDDVRKQAKQLSAADYDPHAPVSLDNAPYLYLLKDDEVSINPEHPYLLGAHLVVIPAMTGSGERTVDCLVNEHRDAPDFSPKTLPGHLLTTLEEADPQQRPQSDLIVIDVPERGLVQLPNQDYMRRIMLLQLPNGTEDTAEEPSETPTE